MIMAMMDELFNEMREYCEKNTYWDYWMTAKEWNERLGKNYTGASFTALVNWGKLERCQSRSNRKAYEYRIVPFGEIKKRKEEQEAKIQREYAERVIATHEERLAEAKARYEEAIKEAEKRLARDLEWAEERLTEAKAILADNK
jgi:hypothetical protein